MKNKTLLNSFILGIFAIVSLSSISCGKETPEDLKETRVDAMSGVLEVNTFYKDGTTSKDIVQGESEVRFYNIEVDSVQAVSMQEGTKGRVNGWIVDRMQPMDSFTYYPESGDLNKNFKLKEVK